MLWATPKGPPRALQASECHELLNPTRASCLILAQRQPGKLPSRGICCYPPCSNRRHRRVATTPATEVGTESRKKLLLIRIVAPLSRQPLVKGERLVRFEVSAAMPLAAVRRRRSILADNSGSPFWTSRHLLPLRAVAPSQR